jgi:hypothetical protein
MSVLAGWCTIHRHWEEAKMARSIIRIRAWALATAMASMAAPAWASLTVGKEAACGKDQWVTGLTGKAGLWIDAVGPTCAGWNERTHLPTDGRAGRPVGGNGGGAVTQSCPAGSAVSAWEVAKVLQGDAAFADKVTLQCSTLAPPQTVTGSAIAFGGRNNLPRGKGKPNKGRCPAGELATSLSVWTSSDGRFVTDVNMRCARAPRAYSEMSTQRAADGSLTVFSPELKLKSGDSVQLDWCREWATHCGKPAADAFCASKGLGLSSNEVAKPNYGLTVVISDQRICNGRDCTSFQQLTCRPRS